MTNQHFSQFPIHTSLAAYLIAPHLALRGFGDDGKQPAGTCTSPHFDHVILSAPGFVRSWVFPGDVMHLSTLCCPPLATPTPRPRLGRSWQRLARALLHPKFPATRPKQSSSPD
ncbi:uncharacterized protein YALI1_F05893g [Yarrowia lipolytica]|uniref:Uncharacterized protein n=1 Tax=Yarrowia lipolytica TaxID=4952 RepID=A0A1D8NLZ3_YARLL|nr:hypothetical protein YALI1_F05893g [Yarrowia lipolytica]